jgi:hypothetical protein
LFARALSWWRIQSLGIFYAQFHIIISVFPYNKLGRLALWNEFKVNNNPDIKESNEHCLHL